MQKHILFGIVGVILGMAIGFFGANSINRDAPMQTAATVSQPAVAADSSTVPKGGMQADVAATLQKAEAEPQNFAVQMKTGDMYAQIGRFDKAIEFYKRGITLRPEDFQANVVIANAYFDLGKFEDAEGFYTRALQINPKDINARTDLGATFVERQNPDYERAIREFRAALEIDPKHEPSLYYVGIAYFRKGEGENANKALADLEKVNAASPLVGKLRQNIMSK
ncbi:MAG: tetratricopeptide repeat protein [Saprospiraceae bacterium]|nr:tetratricopeptide repeat protein [Pyrinomonadaceae bacterium]